MTTENKKSLSQVGEGLQVDLPKLYRYVFFFIVVIVGAYSIWFNLVVDTTLGGPESWGQFGDYFGGMLNPILSALALVILAISLNANVKALKQNETVLELTRLELEKTTRQIEQNNEALTRQVRVVQGNAHGERLSTYADKIYQEILAIRDNDPKIFKPLFPHGPGIWTKYSLYDAFDSARPDFDKIRKADEWDGNWLEVNQNNEIHIFANLLEELMNICILAADTTETDELIRFYGHRLMRWFIGGADLGYLDQTLKQEFFKRITQS